VIARISGNGEPAFITELPITPRDAGVVELLVREVWTDMAGRAVSFSAKNLEPQLLFFGKRSVIARGQSCDSIQYSKFLVIR
jgi:hypothetical protein